MNEDPDGQQRPAKKQRMKRPSSDTENDQSRRTSTRGDEREYTKSMEYYDVEGDMEILSSDEVLIKIPAYIYKRHLVFRDAIKHATNSRLELTDLEIETEEVLVGLLDIINGGKYIVSSKETFALPPIIRLAQKYDCPRVLDCIALQTRCDVLDDGLKAERGFIIGACLNDLRLCVKAMRVNEGCWGDYLDESEKEFFGCYLDNADVMDPAALPYELFQLVKSETMWAWMRAYRAIYGPKMPRISRTAELNPKVSREFQRLMQLKGAPETL